MPSTMGYCAAHLVHVSIPDSIRALAALSDRVKSLLHVGHASSSRSERVISSTDHRWRRREMLHSHRYYATCVESAGSVASRYEDLILYTRSRTQSLGLRLTSSTRSAIQNATWPT